MLSLQAQHLEQQERLYKNQIRLNIREILQGELNFYNNALGTISGSASVLGGFALTSLQIVPAPQLMGDRRATEAVFYFFALGSFGCLLLTVVFAQFTALFSTRLALRGGETSVEETIQRIRGEYAKVMLMMVVGVELFLIDALVLMFTKLSYPLACGLTGIITPMNLAVIFIYLRAQKKFFLDKTTRTFGASDNKKSRSGNAGGAASSSSSSAGDGGKGGGTESRRSAKGSGGGRSGAGAGAEGSGGRGGSASASAGGGGTKRLDYLKEIDKRNDHSSVPNYGATRDLPACAPSRGGNAASSSSSSCAGRRSSSAGRAGSSSSGGGSSRRRSGEGGGAGGHSSRRGREGFEEGNSYNEGSSNRRGAKEGGGGGGLSSWFGGSPHGTAPPSAEAQQREEAAAAGAGAAEAAAAVATTAERSGKGADGSPPPPTAFLSEGSAAAKEAGAPAASSTGRKSAEKRRSGGGSSCVQPDGSSSGGIGGGRVGGWFPGKLVHEMLADQQGEGGEAAEDAETALGAAVRLSEAAAAVNPRPGHSGAVKASPAAPPTPAKRSASGPLLVSSASSSSSSTPPRNDAQSGEGGLLSWLRFGSSSSSSTAARPSVPTVGTLAADEDVEEGGGGRRGSGGRVVGKGGGGGKGGGCGCGGKEADVFIGPSEAPLVGLSSSQHGSESTTTRRRKSLKLFASPALPRASSGLTQEALEALSAGRGGGADDDDDNEGTRMRASSLGNLKQLTDLYGDLRPFKGGEGGSGMDSVAVPGALVSKGAHPPRGQGV